MKILITGAKGQLGYHLKEAFAADELYLGDADNYDVTNRELVLKETERFDPDIIIHAAAYTNVDKAEQEKELCATVNVTGTRHVAEAAKTVDAKLVALSTDYVFAGDKGSPYLESDKPNPLSYYGQTKYEAEQIVAQTSLKHFVVRSAWLYGGPRPTRQRRPERSVASLPAQVEGRPFKNFVYTMLRTGKQQSQVAVVADQLGSPTYANDLAQTIKRLVGTLQYGVYHVTNTGFVSWADFAKEIFRHAGYETTVLPITTPEWEKRNPGSSKRPAYSVLGHEHLLEVGLGELRSWQEALADFLAEF